MRLEGLSRLTVLRISGGRTGELARMADRPLHALVRGREAPEIKRMAIRSTVRGARSVPRTTNSASEVTGCIAAGCYASWGCLPPSTTVACCCLPIRAPEGA